MLQVEAICKGEQLSSVGLADGGEWMHVTGSCQESNRAPDYGGWAPAEDEGDGKPLALEELQDPESMVDRKQPRQQDY